MKSNQVILKHIKQIQSLMNFLCEEKNCEIKSGYTENRIQKQSLTEFFKLTGNSGTQLDHYKKSLAFLKHEQLFCLFLYKRTAVFPILCYFYDEKRLIVKLSIEQCLLQQLSLFLYSESACLYYYLGLLIYCIINVNQKHLLF